MVKLFSLAQVNTVEEFEKSSEEDLLKVKGLGKKMIETVSLRINEYLNDSDNSASGENKSEEAQISEGETLTLSDDLSQEISNKTDRNKTLIENTNLKKNNLDTGQILDNPSSEDSDLKEIPS